MTVTFFTRASGNAGALQGGEKSGGYKWGGVYGSGADLTYSFPGGAGAYGSNYGEGEADGFRAVSSSERAAIRDALAEWGAIANLDFTEVAGGAGDLRFARTTEADDEAAHAYFPEDYPEAGDVWFADDAWHDKPSSAVKKGSYDYLVILHEIGHAIGLKHSFDFPKIDKQYDSFAYTIMSYAASPGQGNYASFYPTTPMYYDILNIQGMYGRGVHNPGDTTYVYQRGQKYWETIDDSGGVDTIVHQGKDKAVIDLNIGKWSDLGKSIKFSVGSTKDTVMIGPGTVIENATGGKGKDKLIGNGADNVLIGGKGKDVLKGGGGDDTFVFTARLRKKNADKIKDFGNGDDVIEIRQKLVKALDKGTVSAHDFNDHFDFSGKGALKYHGKVIAKLGGSADLDHHDLFIV